MIKIYRLALGSNILNCSKYNYYIYNLMESNDEKYLKMNPNIFHLYLDKLTKSDFN